MLKRQLQNHSEQKGQAMVETVVVIFVALLLLLGVIQFGFIYNAKTTLNYATFEAARAGALNYADRTAIEYGLARGLAPLYTSVDINDGILTKVQAVQAARDRAFTEVQDPQLTCIERLNPPVNAFTSSGHGVADSTGLFPGTNIIPNDHLIYRSALPKNGLSIQDANLLKLRVTYCFRMGVPIIANTIQRIMGVVAGTTSSVVLGESTNTINVGMVTPPGAFHRNCFVNGRMPIVAQAIIRMQTPAKNDIFPQNCN